MPTTTYRVSGMHCDHCASAVTQEIGRLDAVESISVDLHVGEDSRVTVTSAAPIDETAVRAAIDEAGYELTGTAS